MSTPNDIQDRKVRTPLGIRTLPLGTRLESEPICANLREYKGWKITASWATEAGQSVQLWHANAHGVTITNRYQANVLRGIDTFEDTFGSLQAQRDELLAACKDIVSFATNYVARNESTPHNKAKIAAARAAIASVTEGEKS